MGTAKDQEWERKRRLLLRACESMLKFYAVATKALLIIRRARRRQDRKARRERVRLKWN